jgi:hypothetical protein
LQASDQAWTVAEQLLHPQQGFQTQFIGAQSLFQKIKREYDYIEKDEPLKRIRDNTLLIL